MSVLQACRFLEQMCRGRANGVGATGCDTGEVVIDLVVDGSKPHWLWLKQCGDEARVVDSLVKL